MKGAAYKPPLNINPPDGERMAAIDVEGRRDTRWWEERRRCAPNLHAVIDAVQERLDDGELPSGVRTRLEVFMVGLSQFQRQKMELSESDRDEQIRLIRAL